MRCAGAQRVASAAKKILLHPDFSFGCLLCMNFLFFLLHVKGVRNAPRDLSQLIVNPEIIGRVITSYDDKRGVKLNESSLNLNAEWVTIENLEKIMKAPLVFKVIYKYALLLRIAIPPEGGIILTINLVFGKIIPNKSSFSNACGSPKP